MSDDLVSDPWPFDLIDLPPFFESNNGLDAATADQRNARKHRGRAFRGCLTCRQRKIKCDNRRPVCLNCERSRLYSCRGFIDNHSTTAARTMRHTTPGPSVGLQTVDMHPPLNSSFEIPLPESSVQSHDDQPYDNCHATLLHDDASFGSYIGALLSPIYADGGEVDLLPDLGDGDLLNFYQTTTSSLMMPVVDPSRNPWLQIYLPLAFGGSLSLSQLALRHAVLSVAANQRAYRNGNKISQDVAKALHHAKEASLLLTQIVDSAEGSELFQARLTLLATALGLISIDIFSPQDSDCNIHLGLARRVVYMNDGDGFWTAYPLANALYQIFRCYDVVAKTAQRNARGPRNESQGLSCRSSRVQDVSPETIRMPEKEDSMLKAHNFILDTAFGVSLKTISLLSQTTDAANACTMTGLHTPALHNMIYDLAIQIYNVESDANDSTIQATPQSPDRAWPSKFSAREHLAQSLPISPLAFSSRIS